MPRTAPAPPRGGRGGAGSLHLGRARGRLWQLQTKGTPLQGGAAPARSSQRTQPCVLPRRHAGTGGCAPPVARGRQGPCKAGLGLHSLVVCRGFGGAAPGFCCQSTAWVPWGWASRGAGHSRALWGGWQDSDAPAAVIHPAKRVRFCCSLQLRLYHPITAAGTVPHSHG